LDAFITQVITNEEAERRGKNYDAEGMTYLFDLDYQDPDSQFTVDAKMYGNVSHFVNHSVSFVVVSDLNLDLCPVISTYRMFLCQYAMGI